MPKFLRYNHSMRIFLSAGEASGDAYAAALVEELRETGGDFTFEGIGGTRLAEAIGPLVVDTSSWGVLSIFHALRLYPRARSGGMRARKKLLEGKPGLFIAIDFGFFNVRQSRWAKKRGWKVLYFMPPSSWRRDHQGRDLPAVADAVVTPFPWSAELLKGIGVNALWFGHPIKQLMRKVGASPRDRALPVRSPSPNPRASAEGPNGPQSAPEVRGPGTIAILPGSRDQEVDRHLPMIADALINAAASPGREFSERFEFAISPNFSLEAIIAKWRELAPGRDDVFTQGDVYGVLGRARAAIVCSGTATIEAALMRCPHVVVYRITVAMAREAKIIRFKKPKFIALPNIVLEAEVVPELVGLDIEPEAIQAAIRPLLADGPEREAQLKAFDEIDRILGPDDAITKTAELIVGMSIEH